MNKRFILLLLLMVLTPGLLLSWFGYRLSKQENSIQEVRLNKLVIEQLRNLDEDIQRYMVEQQQALGLVLSRMDGLNDWRTVSDKHPVIRQTFLLNPQGDRVYPSENLALTKLEKQFLERSNILWQANELYKNASVNEYEEEKSNYLSKLQRKVLKPNNSGWYSWFWGNGLNLVYWVQTANGTIIGADLDVMRIKSDLITILPHTSSEIETDDLIKFIDDGGDLIYQWGTLKNKDGLIPLQRLPLTSPLNGWSLEYYVSDKKTFLTAQQFNALGMISLFMLLSGFIAIYLYKESRRETENAARKVNFVNQVSHELKTPLTNIRMYAELLEDDLHDEDAKTKNYLNIIVNESQRLSRLISNVLSFGRHERNKLSIQTCPGNVANIIKKCLDTFRPSLEQKQFEIVYEDKDLPDVQFDPDALEQILNNLIGNVEKYAADGKYLEIQQEQQHDKTTIRVIDRGLGIPKKDVKKIFQPFYRVSDKINEGVAGTGIGLNLAKELSRLHGGDVILKSFKNGCCFEVSLSTPDVETN